MPNETTVRWFGYSVPAWYLWRSVVLATTAGFIVGVAFGVLCK